MSNQKKPLILKPSDYFDPLKEVFKSGGVIAFPTETFYGLGVDPFNLSAVERLFSLKGRPQDNPVSIIVKNRTMLLRVVSHIPPVAEGLIKRFWPGPLTLVFEAHLSIPAQLVGGIGTIAVRISSSEVCAKLLSTLDSPVTATSANPSGKVPASTPEEIFDYFNGRIDALINGGKLPGRLGSTIVDVTANKIKIIREGEIPSQEILGGGF